MAIAGLIPTQAVDVVGVFTQDFKQVFKNARPIKAVIKETSKLMEHPVENGSTIVDNRIILPTEIELSLVLLPSDYKNTYQQIKKFWTDATLFTVQTRAGSYSNQVIANIPHEEDSEMYDTISIAMSLKEVQFVTAKYDVVPQNSSNNSTVDRGTQLPKTPTATEDTYATQIFGLPPK